MLEIIEVGALSWVWKRGPTDLAVQPHSDFHKNCIYLLLLLKLSIEILF